MNRYDFSKAEVARALSGENVPNFMKRFAFKKKDMQRLEKIKLNFLIFFMVIYKNFDRDLLNSNTAIT